MTVHPQIAEVLAQLPPAPQGPLDPISLRAGELEHLPPMEARASMREVRDVIASTAGGDVPVRIYVPEGEPAQGLLVYFHGGAFFLGGLDTHDHVARALAKESSLVVVSVGYRLAPEHSFPAGLDDCYAVVRWVADHAADLGGDGPILAVAGDSSGGTFAAAVVAMALDDGFTGISHAVLLYPSLDLDFDVDRYASLRENAVGNGLETAGLKPFNAFYVDSGADPADPRVSPIKREDLSGMPRTLIITAEHDPLRDEGELYGQRLGEAGVEVTVSRYEGATHGFMQHFFWVPECYAAFAEVGSFLQADEYVR